MRLFVTADLHFNHRHSKPLAVEVIARMNAEAAPGDAVLIVGDTAAGDGDDLEQCLSLFSFTGPKLVVAGNHELWTRGPDSHRLFTDELPARVRSLGWHWLEESPVVLGNGVAVAGSVGWYDYGFALPHLGIPRRFYEQKISPAAATRFTEYAYLLERTDDISPAGMEVAARWNDGRHVKLHRTDEQFLAERMAALNRDLTALGADPTVTRVIVGVHHVPLAELMPPKPPEHVVTGKAFAGAFLGSPAMGAMLRRHAKDSRVFCGHSHFPARARVDHFEAVNIGSGYRMKMFEVVEV
ncbi:metallophosphoesterase [Humisphaera borealis]|uniref:Metallophosphoesterase n=1 Tax=Humisphaera borealis TaxID=2807512 RepID=A0A7M2X479_9BACT|nr:metallophosphoesterase [Humisphaera borealis]QOV92252.1 metallophosphoesterase [Humisphaera borealis]